MTSRRGTPRLGTEKLSEAMYKYATRRESIHGIYGAKGGCCQSQNAINYVNAYEGGYLNEKVRNDKKPAQQADS